MRASLASISVCVRLPRFTLTAWLRSLTHHHPAQEGLFGMFGETLSAPLSLLVLVTVTLLCLAAAAAIFSKREYVLEQ